ncbi:hypothetical protein B296_00009691 [Ensete ventricosum]|uniref:Uncharacterized protein n=1 Tax=Ensete ventricosum TaxID=4639 RepID=A0A426Y757_ENSVE|nr:hypothetical protein B296_00009691 [Ensete ventricosum]
MGGLPVGLRRLSRLKYPDSWVSVVQPPTLGGSAAINRLKTWVATVHPPFISGLLVKIFVKVVPSTFRISACT